VNIQEAMTINYEQLAFFQIASQSFAVVHTPLTRSFACWQTPIIRLN